MYRKDLKNVIMKNSVKILVLMLICFIQSCMSEKTPIPQFSEIILDSVAPTNLWMKTIGDINSDGKMDMLVGGWNGGGMVAYLAPDWEKQIINDSLKISTDAEVCDVNNDNNQDVLAVVNKALVWFEGPGWEIHLIDSLIGHDVEVNDFDDDGLMDAVVRNQGDFGTTGGHTLYFYNQKKPDNWAKYQMDIADGEGLKIADINDDKRMDVVTNGFWFENTGNMSDWLGHKFTDTWEWSSTAIDVADINNDGLPDILLSPSELAGTHYRISWFEAPEESSSFWKEHVVADSVETVVHSMGTADFNLDGNTDIIVAEMQQGADPDEVSIFYNFGVDKWEKQVISTGGSHSMRLYDFDGDGDIDILGANHAENIVKMWINELQK